MKKAMILPMLIVLILAVVLLVVIYTKANPDNPILPKRTLVECTVSVSNPLFLKPKIDSQSCVRMGDCFFDNPLSIISDKGRLKVDMGDGSDSAEYDITETQSRAYRLEVCTSRSSGTLSLLDDQGQIIEEKQVNVQ